MSTQTTLKNITHNERKREWRKDTEASTQKLHERREFEARKKIRFPWRWQYATVEELNDDEVLKFRERGCDLCNARGISHRKISDNNNSLLCTECATRYIEQALALHEKLRGESLGDN